MTRTSGQPAGVPSRDRQRHDAFGVAPAWLERLLRNGWPVRGWVETPAAPARISAAPKALRSSITTGSAGIAIGDSRQARWPVSWPAAGTDAASIASQCPHPLQSSDAVFVPTAKPPPARAWGNSDSQGKEGKYPQGKGGHERIGDPPSLLSPCRHEQLPSTAAATSAHASHAETALPSGSPANRRRTFFWLVDRGLVRNRCPDASPLFRAPAGLGAPADVAGHVADGVEHIVLEHRLPGAPLARHQGTQRRDGVAAAHRRRRAAARGRAPYAPTSN